MNLSIRHWLVENYIEISHIKECSQGQMTGVALRIIRDMEVRSPSPFDICTLAEVLELPLRFVWHEVGVFARLTESILSLLGRNKPFNRNEATWLAFQVAYLQALEEVLIEEQSRGRVWLERLVDLGDEERKGQGKNFSLFANASVKPLGDKRLQALIKIVREEKLSDVQAEEALLTVADSYAVERINRIAVAWLVANSVLEAEAELIIQRLKNKLLGHLIVVVSKNAATLVQLQKFFRLGNSVESKTTNDINFYREKYRASLIRKLGEPLLIESFSLKDIYIPPAGLPFKGNHQPVDLMKWVVSQLDDLETITVIESESGYGKTSFCQILAARIAHKLYPEWMPVNICLGEVKCGDNFQETLESAFINNSNSEINLSSWLEESQTKYLLILDGLNELPNCAENKMAIAIFLRQLLEFQSRFNHKIILTSQSWALEDVVNKAASQLRRIKIQPWGQDEWKQWFANWAKVQSITVSQNLFSFLKNNKAFSRKSHFLLSDLVRQPLMLYLLAVLHRDELIDDEILESATNPQITNTAVVLWKIYERLNQWLLGYPVRSVSQKILASSINTHIHRTPEAVNLLIVNSLSQNQHPQELINQMQVVALQILYSRNKKIDLKSDFNSHLAPFSLSPNSRLVSRRLSSPHAPRERREINFKANNQSTFQRTGSSSQSDLSDFAYEPGNLFQGGFENGTRCKFNQLPAFYFKQEIEREKEFLSPMPNAPCPIPPSKIKLSHAKFGEYLCAASIINQLKALTKRTRNAYGEMIFAYDSTLSVAEHLYQLLGYGILTREIEQLIIEGLRNSHSSKFSFELLCDRLLSFWYAYSGGKWLDEGIAHKAWFYFKQLQNPLNVEQVNAAVGINVFLLLSACYKQTKRTFSPCGNPFSLTESHPQAVTKLIAKTAFFHPDITRLRIGEKSLTFLNLVKADLTQAMLAGINFTSTDLSNVLLKDACLTGANLADANLTGADLTGANLTNANLTNAKLTGANLTGANLLGVNLDLANLSNACLFQAIIAEAQKETAIANGAVFSLDKFEELKRLLSYQSQADDTNKGEITEIAFNDNPSIGEIESAEGEPSMSLDLNNDMEDETVLGTTDF